MSNTRRPTTARKITPKDEAKRRSDLDAMTMGIKVAGVEYWLYPADVNGLVEMRVRRETGLSLTEIMALAGPSMGVDILGYFMFASEIAAGRDADLEKILGSVSWAAEIDVLDDKAESVPQP